MSLQTLPLESGNSFDTLGRFILSDYQHKAPFSSFLPGIAGLQGIPMWVFYVNRGQAICSFGVESKDHPIVEFQAANKAYQATALLGFRTFLNGKRVGTTWQQEAFYPWRADDIQRTLFIGMNEVEIQEVNHGLGYQINILYFMLPNLPFSGLVRQVSLKNLKDSSLALEVLDGLPCIVPYGVDNGALKHIGRTIEAWMQVDNLDNRLPFYCLKATPSDTAEVSTIHAGNYALAFSDGKLLPAIADPVAIFGMDTGLARAHDFHELGLANVFQKPQTLEGRSLCAFFGTSFEIDPGETRSITSLYGFSKSLPMIQSKVQELTSPGFIDRKLMEARELPIALTDVIKTESTSTNFDAYCRQAFLDNLLRGGYPFVLGDKHIYHIYSRKHGDIERDYNYFVLAPEYYSQGNGNYRDINQNRRNDVFFVPQAGVFNIRLFMSLIQADGYNPLVISGVSFSIDAAHQADILRHAKQQDRLAKVLARWFTPGELFEAVLEAQILIPVEELLHQVFSQAETHIQAEHGEGYWIDHWTYNLDLIEAYLSIYPDQQAALLFESAPLPFFDNSHVVQPRHERYVLSDGKPRQLNAVVEDQEKASLIQSRTIDQHWARTDQGRGEVFRLPLFSKLTLLAMTKFVTLDPSGKGIQMEAGRPGWYDALNGLPGLFGSSTGETCELLRLVNFLSDVLIESPREVSLPIEAQILIDAIASDILQKGDCFSIWDHLTEALEAYRESVRLGFDGKTLSSDVSSLLSRMRVKLEEGIKKANAYTDGIPPMYFVHEVSDYALTGTTDPEGRPHVQVKDFQALALPAFLEGPVHQMKISTQDEVGSLYERIKKSNLFDRKLGMYKVNAPLEAQSHEIGRARAFTPGWLENESIWMHMAFKYLLELQKAGLNEVFFKELENHLPAFMVSDNYGRSPLENSSFIVSSAHPDVSLHGKGFVARLSGSTAEFLNMWVLMTIGKQPFRLEQGELVLEILPKLPGWMFTADGSFEFRFLGSIEVRLHNPSRKDTYAQGLEVQKIVLHSNAEIINIRGGVIGSPYAGRVREGGFSLIELFYE